MTEDDARAAYENLGSSGSYYKCHHCAYWHLSRGPFAEVVPGGDDGDRTTYREMVMWRGNHRAEVNKKRRQHERLTYALAAGELAWRWLDHLLEGGPQPEGPVADIRALLDRAME